MHTSEQYDMILAGGGLANGLLALCLKRFRPELRILLVESQSVLGGNHTWSFHLADMEQAPWLASLISKHWERYEVRFPAYRRVMEGGYASILSSSFHETLCKELDGSVLLGRAIHSLTPSSVTLADNRERLGAHCVIDGRGIRELCPSPAASSHAPPMGFQKFLGWEVELSAPHGLRHPVLMDAEVVQLDGFRFFYALPFSPTRLLVEDTRYSDNSVLDAPALRAEIEAYCRKRDWGIQSIDREEKGVLPIPFSIPRPAGGASDVPAIGLAGGLFHPVTGYSLPLAVQVANGITALPDITSQSVNSWLDSFRSTQKLPFEYLAFLNRMLFQAAEPEHRYQVLQRFYRLSPGLIDRFYSMQLKGSDYIRILSGRPPVPVLRALGCIRRTPQATNPLPQGALE